MKKNSELALLLGVCAGLGDHVGIDKAWIRLAFVLFFLSGGAGLLLYLILAIVME
jgi:phage shock protein C